MNYKELVRFVTLACALWMAAAGITNATASTPAIDDVGDPGDPYNLPVGPPAPVIPPSKLLNFDSPARIPGRLLIRFKSNDELARDVTSDLANSLKVGPGIVPNTPANITMLAKAMSAWYQHKENTANSILDIWVKPDLRGFSVQGINDNDIAELALDPRIRYIEPDMYAQAVTSVQNTGKPGCSGTLCAPWHLDRIDQQLGTDGLYHYDVNGEYTFIAIIDSGVQAGTFGPLAVRVAQARRSEAAMLLQGSAEG